MDKFTPWFRWKDRNEIMGIAFPGVYCLRTSSENIHGNDFEWHEEIAYIGMTRSEKGLKGRLKQFDNTIMGKTGHGGADRFRYKYPDYEALSKILYISAQLFLCNTKEVKPEDLRVMGTVVKTEYDCIAKYLELFGRLPEFDHMKRPRPPKYSKHGNEKELL
jgi:hypothetical protein